LRKYEEFLFGLLACFNFSQSVYTVGGAQLPRVDPCLHSCRGRLCTSNGLAARLIATWSGGVILHLPLQNLYIDYTPTPNFSI